MTPPSGPRTNRYERILRIRPAFLAVALKAILRPGRIEVQKTAGRFLVDPASNLGHRLITAPAYEPWLEQRLRDALHEGATFVDVGANEGYFTVLGGTLVGAGGRVIAIEPQERALRALTENVRLNGLANVETMAVLLGSAEGVGTLHLAPSTNTGASGTRSPVRYPVRRQRVRVTTLDSLLEAAGATRCDLLKLDVEGAEVDVLRGARRALAEGLFKAVVVELHPRLLEARGETSAGLRELLVSHGYRLAGADDLYELYHVSDGA